MISLSSRLLIVAVVCFLTGPCKAHGQKEPSSTDFDVTADLHVALAKPKASTPPAVLWLKPVSPAVVLDPMPTPRGGFTLLQKDKLFIPHILVVPVGTVVSFPNQDPFFHNVFSLFDGKRFDLGLYEAGSTKGVTFSHEGVSYVFCNIHSEMSAVVIALSTPLYSIADRRGAFLVHHVPAGEYEVHVWVEGQPQATLDQLTRKVSLSAQNHDLKSISLGLTKPLVPHLNKEGQPYDKNAAPPY